MSQDARAAIQAVRIKRLQKAVEALEAALSEGCAVSKELVRVSGLLDRGIDLRQIRSTFNDLPGLLALAREIEAQQIARPEPVPQRSSRRLPV